MTSVDQRSCDGIGVLATIPSQDHRSSDPVVALAAAGDGGLLLARDYALAVVRIDG